MSSDTAIAVENLSKSYHIYNKPLDRLLQMLARGRKQYFREFWALKNISLEIKKGETWGIIGKNGSGKSTLLQLICGTLNPTTGSISTRGRIAALLELGSGFNSEFTGRENVYLNASVLGLRREEIDSKFDAIVAFADIGEFIDQPVKTYSSGMYVRLAFAVIANVDADILIIDEALAVGDALFTQKCMRFLRNFKTSGTLLFVSHDTVAVNSLCDKAIWLDHGCMLANNFSKEVSEAYLASLYAQSSSMENSRYKSNFKSEPRTELGRIRRDMRADIINNSNLRNDIEIFEFQPDSARGFGAGGAEICSSELFNTSYEHLSHIVGGEDVILRITIHSSTELKHPIVGFSFKDRTGQVLFGDNTYISHGAKDLITPPDHNLVAEFHFTMPILAPGDYSIAAAVADGTQQDHVQHHWIHDAIILKSTSSSLSTGLIGIPVHEINCYVISKAD